MLKNLNLNILFLLLAFILQALVNASNTDSELKIEDLSPVAQANSNDADLAATRNIKYYYTYIDRDHTREENLNNLAGIYAVTWVLYPLTQLGTVKEQGSLRNYRNNFGKIVFDKDEPFWNWFVHPISGSQLFLFYRSRGYSRSESLTMSFISSSLFEFTVEIYTEPASVQDLYQTPVLGAVLGLGIEKFSLYLLNSGNVFGKFFGHLINPQTLFWYYEGKIRILPVVAKNQAGLNVQIDF